jgi:hypothetical protein
VITHHLQKQILHHLVTVECASFSELKPEDIEGNIFTYHLQQLIKQKNVEKRVDGSYCLTPDGKAVGINIKLSAREALQQAHSVLFMALKTENGWLVRKRLAHPMFGKVGFVHGEPIADEDIAVTAQRVFRDKTGLTARFVVAGSGYVRLFKDESLESFTHFTLLLARTAEGELLMHSAKHVNGENFWLERIEDTTEDLIPGMQHLAEQLTTENLFFSQLEFHL